MSDAPRCASDSNGKVQRVSRVDNSFDVMSFTCNFGVALATRILHYGAHAWCVLHQRMLMHSYLLFSITDPPFICFHVGQGRELRDVGIFNSGALVWPRARVPCPAQNTALTLFVSFLYYHCVSFLFSALLNFSIRLPTVPQRPPVFHCESLSYVRADRFVML